MAALVHVQSDHVDVGCRDRAPAHFDKELRRDAGLVDLDGQIDRDCQL